MEEREQEDLAILGVISFNAYCYCVKNVRSGVWTIDGTRLLWLACWCAVITRVQAIFVIGWSD